LITIVGGLLLGLAAGSAPADGQQVFVSAGIESFFSSYCYNCHDSETQKGDLNLEDLSRKITTSTDAAHWQDVLDQMNAGEMPPKKKKQPSTDELANAIATITESLFAAQDMLKDSGGRIVPRRLNRREYVATIKDLTGIRVNSKTLPDDASGRFDTIGQNQSLNAMQLDKLFAFNREVVRTAFFWAVQPRQKSKVKRKEDTGAKAEKKVYELLEKVKTVHETDKTYAEVGLTEAEWIRYNRGSEKYPRHAEYRDRKTFAQYYANNLEHHGKGRMLSILNLVRSTGIPIDRDARAHYKLRANLGVLDGIEKRRVVRMTVPEGGLGAGHGKPVGSFSVTGTIDEPSIHEMIFRPIYAPSFRPTSARKRARSVSFLEDRRGGPSTVQLHQHYKHIEPEVPSETILVRWLESEGPFYDPKTIFETLVDTHAVATATDEKLDKSAAPFLRDFAAEAFRGQTVDEELIVKLEAYYKSRRVEGLGFREAMVDPLAMILCSPRFLYLLEPGTEDRSARQLNAVNLASRLSYFLWSSPPDAELLELAKSGELLKPETLGKQIDRMLVHEKASAFYEGFMGQWLHLKRLDEVGLNSRRHLAWTDAMVHSAKQEPVAFFKTLTLENLSAANLIDSDFVTIDGVLANRYGLRKLYPAGDGFKKIKLPPESPRGGLMTQTAFLAIGTMGNRTSPVIRGSLVKEILLNDPPPDPPANVPELVQAGVDPLASVRSLVHLHQKKAQCASCHARFDFIGLGLENFDALGMWRDKEIVSHAEYFHQTLKKGKHKVYPVDASGELPNGETFNNVQELKTALMKDKRQVAESLLEGLLCYALGRDVTFTDRPLIQHTLDKLEATDYPVRDLIKRAAASKQFRQR
jgi:hypothetical protein